MKTVYLAGPMTGLTVAAGRDTWRARATAFFRAHGVKACSPMRDYDELKLDHKMGAFGEDRAGGHLVAAKFNYVRDVNDIRTADAVAINTQGATRVSVGTSIEYGMACIADKPTLALLDPLHDHLFFREGPAVLVKDEVELYVGTLSLLNVEIRALFVRDLERQIRDAN